MLRIVLLCVIFVSLVVVFFWVPALDCALITCSIRVLAPDWILYFSSTPAMAQAWWQYQSNHGFWRDMPEEYSSLHETAFDEGVFKFKYNTPFAGGTKNYDYAVYLDTFWQHNKTRGTWRRIRRVGGVMKKSKL